MQFIENFKTGVEAGLEEIQELCLRHTELSLYFDIQVEKWVDRSSMGRLVNTVLRTNCPQAKTDEK